MAVPADISRVEKRLRVVLDKYSQASVGGDFLKAVLGIHTALEDALDLHLGEVAQELSFNQKFERFLPDIFSGYDVRSLTSRRNDYGHMKRDIPDEEIRETAEKFARVSLAAWPRLFNSSPPVIQHPPLVEAGDTASAQRALREKDALIRDLQKQVEREGRRSTAGSRPGGGRRSLRFAVPWRPLLAALLLLPLLPLLAGFSHGLSGTPNGRLWSVVVGAAALALALLVLINLWRVVRRVGWLRTFAFLSALLVLATLVRLPATPEGMRWSIRPAAALEDVLSFVEGAFRNGGTALYQGGERLAERLLSPDVEKPAFAAEPEVSEPPLSGPASTSAPVSPAASDRSEPGSLVAVGGQARVVTSGTRLMCRAKPATAAAIEARLEHGKVFTITGGPETASGYTWWQLSAVPGGCWSVADFLEAVVSP